jgi:hypothetical protein
MAVNNDSTWLFLTTPSGVREVALPPFIGQAVSFVVSGLPASAQAGAPVNLTVTAVDSKGHVVPNYTGTVHFTSSDRRPVYLPADYAFTGFDQGSHSFTAVLATAGTQTVSATDTQNASLKGSAGLQIVPGPAWSYGVSWYGTTTSASGTPAVASGYDIKPTATVYDRYNNVVTNYTGTVHLSSSDPAAQLSPDYTFTAADKGTHQFSATLFTTGNQSFTFTDTANPSVKMTVNVTVANYIPGLHFVATPATQTPTAGTAFGFTVTALDQYNQVATRYVGTVTFSTSDAGAGVVLPADYTFTAADAGVHTFPVTLVTAGTRSVSFRDTTWVTGAGVVTTNFTVSPAAASTFRVAGFPAETAGTSGTFTVTAYDPYGNVATGYGGTVHFTSSDAQASLPADATLTNGTGTFTATLKTAGAQSLTATDAANANLSGTEAGIAVSAAAASMLVLSAPGSVTAGVAFTFTVTLVDAYGNVATGYVGTVHFSSSDALAGLPPDYTFTAADAGTTTFTGTFNTTGSQTLTAEDDLDGLSATLAILVLTP